MAAPARYRIQTVAELTGVNAATLRAWERRYGVPTPSRSAGGYRLYSDDDVTTVRRLGRLIEGGMAPAEAARSLKERLESEAEDAATPTAATDAHSAARERILEAAGRFDADGIEDAVQWAMSLGRASTVFQEVLAPVMREVGERWHAGTLSVAQEHLVTSSLQRPVRVLLGLVQPEPPAPIALLACFPDEHHSMPLLGLALELAQAGIRSVVLGARTPPDAVAEAVGELRPDIVALSVTVTPDDADAIVAGYAEACQDVPWVVGGMAASRLAEAVEAAGGRVVRNGDPAGPAVTEALGLPTPARR